MSERVSLAITVKAPGACDADELKAFEALVREGGEVESHGLAPLIRQANALAFVHSSDHVVGVGALKRPLASYRKSVFEKSVAAETASEFPLELGWTYVVPDERGGDGRDGAEAAPQQPDAVHVGSTSARVGTVTRDYVSRKTGVNSGFVQAAGTPLRRSRGTS